MSRSGRLGRISRVWSRLLPHNLGRLRLSVRQENGKRRAWFRPISAICSCKDPSVSLSASLAADSSQNAKFAKNQHINVYRLVVPHHAGLPLVPIGACAVSFDVKYHFFFIFEPPPLLHREQPFPVIVLHGHVLHSRGSPIPKSVCPYI